MPVFTTGPSTLPDIGKLSYNGCVFSPLFETTADGVAVKDEANRTVKYMEYTITADGYVTLPAALTQLADGVGSVANQMATLQRLLNAQAGSLIYKGRGFDLVVNTPGNPTQDVAWGPVPEILDFVPLGAGRSAKIKWQVKTRVPQIAVSKNTFLTPVLQFNEDTSVNYDEAGFSSLSIRGTLEIPMTRLTQTNRLLTQTVDTFRVSFMKQVAESIDLTRFRITRRNFAMSRDKRTLEWDFAAEELPWFGMPAGVTIARGHYNVKPSKMGAGLVNWLCTLRVTYTIPNGTPRRRAWQAFLALLRVRMLESRRGNLSNLNGGGQNPGIAAQAVFGPILPPALNAVGDLLGFGRQVLNQQNPDAANPGKKAILIDFTIDEGLYLDSKTVTFSASWKLITTFSHILLASGLWKKVRADGGNNWAISVKNISGGKSWLVNQFNPAQDVIVDFGGP